MTENAQSQLEEKRNFIMNIGLIAIHSAYLEEELDKLIDVAAPLLKEKEQKLTIEITSLKKVLKNAYDKVSNQKDIDLIKDIEQEADKLINAAMPSSENKVTKLKRYQLASRAENLKKALKEAHNKVPSDKKSYAVENLIKLLEYTKQAAEERNHMMHSIYESNADDQLIEKTYSKKDPNSPPQEILLAPKEAKEKAERLIKKIRGLYWDMGHAKSTIYELMKDLAKS